jgi:hypothetical protein
MNVSTQPRFKDVITTEAQIRRIVEPAEGGAVTKVIDRIDDHCRRFIARSPFIVIASASAPVGIDVSPKGDPAGFVRVLDEKTLAIPDRPGNNRLDTFTNILRDPRLGVIFFVPRRKETLRVGGRATIVRDEDLRRSMAMDGKVPELALVVDVERAFFHCAKCVVRSNLWEPEKWPDTTGLSSLGEALRDHAKLHYSAREIDDYLAADEKEGLY